MKTNHLIFLFFLAFTTMFSSCKKERNQTVIVVRDCTGTYLRLDGKDYHVCNLEKVSSFSDCDTVTATFKKIKECNGSAKGTIVCYVVHVNEGWIEVDKLR